MDPKHLTTLRERLARARVYLELLLTRLPVGQTASFIPDQLIALAEHPAHWQEAFRSSMAALHTPPPSTPVSEGGLAAAVDFARQMVTRLDQADTIAAYLIQPPLGITLPSSERKRLETNLVQLLVEMGAPPAP